MIEKKALTKEQTKDKALRLLEFRNHSEFELRQKLSKAGAKDDDIDSALAFCIEYGFVNDENYALCLARDLNKIKKYGKQRIYLELKNRGLSAENIEAALSEIEDDTNVLHQMIEKKLKGDFSRKNCDKAIRYFMYRGYGLTDIKNSIERLISYEL